MRNILTGIEPGGRNGIQGRDNARRSADLPRPRAKQADWKSLRQLPAGRINVQLGKTAALHQL